MICLTKNLFILISGNKHKQVEFDTPVGYQEPERIRKVTEAEQDAETNQQIHYDTQSFVAFSGEGNRLDGKKKKCDKPEAPQTPRVRIAHYQYYHRPSDAITHKFILISRL